MLKANKTFSPREYLDLVLGEGNYDFDDSEELYSVQNELYAQDTCLWDYPLNEMDYVFENEINVVLVKFNDGEYRLCEVFEDTFN